MIITKQQRVILMALESQGFDASYPSESGGVRARCSQCAALVINGVACHEQGCPNQRREEEVDDDDC